MNKIIRSLDISTYKKLQEEIEQKLIKQLKRYMTWQWYNQKCSDLIEDLILTQSNIIQTPKKIKISNTTNKYKNHKPNNKMKTLKLLKKKLI